MAVCFCFCSQGNVRFVLVLGLVCGQTGKQLKEERQRIEGRDAAMIT